MSGVEQTLGGARWISVEPKSTTEKLVEFLSNMGFVTPGQQYFVMAAVVLLFIAIIWMMSRPIQPKVARGARVPRSRSLGIRARRGATATPAPLPMQERGATERGEATPLRPASAEAKAKAWIDFSNRRSAAPAGPKPAQGV